VVKAIEHSSKYSAIKQVRACLGTIGTRAGPRTNQTPPLFRLATRKLDNLAPLFGFVGNQFAEVSG
jgi:hypothetical protein